MATEIVTEIIVLKWYFDTYIICIFALISELHINTEFLI